MLEIIPAILTNNPQELEEKIREVEGLVSRVQIDIIDGVFADNKTISLESLANLDTALLLDVHLMTKDPSLWVEKSVRAMADRVIGQIELMENQEDFVYKVQEAARPVGLAIDLETPVASLDPLLLNNLDVILVMAVKAGFSGQEFDTRVVDKIKELAEIREKDLLKFRICVDGGVNAENIKSIEEAGADEVAVAHSLYDGDVKQNLEILLALVTSNT